MVRHSLCFNPDASASFFFYTRGTFNVETTVLNTVNAVVIAGGLFYLSKVNDDLKLYKVKNTRVP